ASGGKVGIDPANNSVSINNLPPVQLATTATNPALVREVENIGRQAFQAEISVKVTDGATTGTGLLTFADGSTKVPAGKQLLIKQVSAAAIAQGPTGLTANLVTTVGNRSARHFLTLQSVGFNIAGFNRMAGSQAMEVYADPGTQVG